MNCIFLTCKVKNFDPNVAEFEELTIEHNATNSLKIRDITHNPHGSLTLSARITNAVVQTCATIIVLKCALCSYTQDFSSVSSAPDYIVA